MKMPKIGSRRHKIVTHFIDAGEMTINEYISKFGMMGFTNMRDFKNELSALCCSLIINRNGYVYSAFPIQQLIKKQGPYIGVMVKPRTPSEFMEISAKYMTPTVSPRGQPMREITLIGLGASIVEPKRF